MTPSGFEDKPMQNNVEAEFDEYLKEEYRHIAEAHFRTMEAISSFFRYYLLIMSLPVTLIAVLISLPQSDRILDVVNNFKPLFAGVFLIISLVGFCVLLYSISLRMDAVLYARTINSIRKHFYDKPFEDINKRLRIRILPQTSSQPAYMEFPYFFPVVLSFALFDFFYLFCSLVMFGIPSLTAISVDTIPRWAWLALVFIVIHCGAYWWYARHREHSYLKSYAIGVDIDGVLNKHREHFCKLLNEKTGKSLDPESITTIPLHECPDLGVTREDEKQVFNDSRYWIEMPVIEGAQQNLERIRNMNLRVHLFSHRPWPNTFRMEEKQKKQIHTQWRDGAQKMTQNGSLLQLLFFKFKTTSHLIECITRSWLKIHNLPWDELTIERGNENVADPQGQFRNRFYVARKKKLKFFVEDDLEKAIKLSYICDVVFLLEQPYNMNTYKRCSTCQFSCKQQEKHVPSNVIRVQSWDDICKSVRRLS